MILILVQLVVLLVGLGFLYLREHYIVHEVNLSTVNSTLKKTIEHDAYEIKKRYTSRLEGFIKTSDKVISAFSQHDRLALQRALENKIKTLMMEDPFFYSISFIFPDGTVFFRSRRNEPMKDNVLDIPFAKESLEKRVPLGGLSIGRWGIANRFSQPVFHQQKYVGTIVFVVQPLRALKLMSEMYDIDSGIFIDNKHLHLPQMNSLPPSHNKTLLASVGTIFDDPQLSGPIATIESGTRFSNNGRHYIKYQPVPILDYNGQQLGIIIPVEDVTRAYHNMIETIVRAAILSTIITSIAMCVLYFGLGIILKRLKKFHTELEKRVELRTTELSQVNQQLEREIIERTQAEKSLQLLCQQDSLTGISNRRHFDSVLQLEWNTAIREKRKLSILMIDIDSFKNYNDNYGHIEGDKCLCLVAQTLAKQLRRSRDLVARFGGEEFICLLPETDQEEAIAMANKLCTKIKDLTIPHHYSSVAPEVTISIGVCCMAPHIDEVYQVILSRADEAMYYAKNNGRNQVHCYKF